MSDDLTTSEYVVTIAGLDHTVMLTKDDAERLGATKAKATASTKASTPANKSKG